MESLYEALQSVIDALCELCRKQGLDDSEIAKMKNQFLSDVQRDARKRLQSYQVVALVGFNSSR